MNRANTVMTLSKTTLLEVLTKAWAPGWKNNVPTIRGETVVWPSMGFTRDDADTVMDAFGLELVEADEDQYESLNAMSQSLRLLRASRGQLYVYRVSDTYLLCHSSATKGQLEWIFEIVAPGHAEYPGDIRANS